MRRQHFGIKLKITVAFSLVFIFLSFSFNMYCYRQIRSLIIQDNNNYLLSRAETLLDKTEISPVIIPLPDSKSQIRVFYHSGQKQVNLFQSPGIISRIKTPLKTGVTDTLGMRVAYLINKSEENPAEILLVRSGEHLTNNLHYLLLLLFACSLVSVVLASLISYILAVYLLRPVQRIINSANLINANKLRDLIPVKRTRDELQELTETINLMLTRIDESLQQQQNFFASASHELKTPLAIMRAEIEVDLKKAGRSAETVALMQSQLAEIDRLQQVVQEFLLISQLKSSGIVLHKEPVDISSVVLKLFHRLQVLLDRKQVTITTEFDKESDTFIINADQDKIMILLLNIAENAIKYCVGGSQIHCFIKGDQSANLLQIILANAIRQESISTDDVKGAFQRADMSQNGAGLGLWLANEIAGLHNGSLQLSSSNYLFEITVELPVS